MKKVLLGITVLLLVSTGMAVAEEVTVGGGGAAISSIFRPVDAAFEKATGMQLVIKQSSPKNGLIEMSQGRLDAAVAAVSLDSMIAGAEKDGVKIDASTLNKREIGINKTVVFLHKDNQVKALTKDQLKGIFTGKITNWKDAGGKDAPIVVVWGKASPGQNALFTKVVLDGEAVMKEVLDATDYASIREMVASTPEGIGIDPLGMADATVSVPQTPPVTSPIIMITKGAPSPKVQKLIDFIATDGQQYIRK